MNKGYTLIELMIVITITAVLVAFGISGYTKAQKNQNIKSATELILSALTEAQKRSSSGTKDCNGVYLGQKITMASNGHTITSVALCEGEEGSPATDSLAGVTFTANHTLTFKPLNQGVNLTGVTTENVDYTDGTSTYRIEVMRSGSIRSVGKL